MGDCAINITESSLSNQWSKQWLGVTVRGCLSCILLQIGMSLLFKSHLPLIYRKLSSSNTTVKWFLLGIILGLNFLGLIFLVLNIILNIIIYWLFYWLLLHIEMCIHTPVVPSPQRCPFWSRPWSLSYLVVFFAFTLPWILHSTSLSKVIYLFVF